MRGAILAGALAGIAAAGALGGPVGAAAAPTGVAQAAPAPGTTELVTLLSPHLARSRPNPGATVRARVPARTPITGRRAVMPVLAHHGSWLLVRLPGRPNAHRGWIAAAGTDSASTPWRIVVHRDRRRVTALRFGRAVRTFAAIVGTPQTPTPLGDFYVEESIALPAGAVGAPFALALSARSTVLQAFAGGPGQIALHGLGGVGGTLGQALSHGCVRLADRTIDWLVRRVGPGVPVTVVR